MIHVFGAGGHAKVVIAAILDAGLIVEGVYDDAAAKFGESVIGIPVKGPIAAVPDEASVTCVIAIGDNNARRQIAARFRRVHWTSVVHPAAWVHRSVSIGAGSVICAGAIIQPDAVIGEHAIINSGARIDHDCDIRSFAHVGPGAVLAGNVEVGVGTLLGVGSAVLPDCRIGEWCVVGGGAAVVDDLPAGVVAYGVPARQRILVDSRGVPL